MKEGSRMIATAALLTLLTACSREAPQDAAVTPSVMVPPEAVVERSAEPGESIEVPGAELLAAARAGVQAFAAELQQTLGAAMAQGGPLAGIEVCRVSAPVIAEAASNEHDMLLARTAMRVRNPANAPDAFERATLDLFAQAVAQGEAIAALEHSAIVETADGQQEFRYMKAIGMQAQPCAACHGDSLAPEIAAAIAQAYPEDQAVGFAPGELRGAFTIRKRLP
jgi:hypothetical protein